MGTMHSLTQLERLGAGDYRECLYLKKRISFVLSTGGENVYIIEFVPEKVNYPSMSTLKCQAWPRSLSTDEVGTLGNAKSGAHRNEMFSGDL